MRHIDEPASWPGVLCIVLGLLSHPLRCSLLLTGCFAMADGKLFRLVLIVVLVHAVAAFIASCARPNPPMDWKSTLDEAGAP